MGYDAGHYNVGIAHSDNHIPVEENSTNSLDQDALDSGDRQMHLNDSWQQGSSNEQQSGSLLVSIPLPIVNATGNSEPPLKVPKINNLHSASENTWDNCPSSPSSPEWHIPTSNSSSPSECAGENEGPDVNNVISQDNVQSSSESSNCSLSRTSFTAEEKEPEVQKSLKIESNEKAISIKPAEDSESFLSSGKDECSIDATDGISINRLQKNSNENIVDESINAAAGGDVFDGSVTAANGESISEVDPIPDTPALSDDFWKKQNPLVDHVLITDVTTNLLTVTVRECDTSCGFFKDRPNPDITSNSPKSNEGHTL
ncbi:polycomb group protein Pc-like [Stegodyphus dumicola]|uniref:polycomb group protein Pc-like n=1 Tax=Stegodyphus dumicola TaxID=202533 RepID=UPI0015A7D03A|nr:polycomb group protein Pc-like [Stegodyphus dumicola]